MKWECFIYGKVIFVQTIVAYFSIIIQFGFNNSATKEVSMHRNDKLKLNNIVSAILEIKFVLWLSSLLILILLVNLIPGFEEDKWLYCVLFITVIKIAYFVLILAKMRRIRNMTSMPFVGK